MAHKPQQQTFEDFVPVFIARNLNEADYYQLLLEQHDIPVQVKQKTDNAEYSRNVSLTVPENCFSDAQDIIEQRPFDDADYDDDYSSDDDEGFDIIDSDFDIFEDEDYDDDIEEEGELK